MRSKKGDAMKDHNFENAPYLRQALNHSASRSIEIDVERYQAYLDNPALSAAQKEEIISALWKIMSAFVELGFGIHPIQQACGQLSEDPLSQEADTEAEAYLIECNRRLHQIVQHLRTSQLTQGQTSFRPCAGDILVMRDENNGNPLLGCNIGDQRHRFALRYWVEPACRFVR